MDDEQGTPTADDSSGGLPAALVLHGLWQPVSTLNALAVALTRGWPTLGEDERRRLASDIEAETARLRDLAEELTTLGMLDGQGYRPALRRERVVDLLRDAAASVGELGGRLRVRLEPSAVGATVLGDRGRVLQVLKAFLRRADDSSDGGTNVILRAHLHGEGATFAVEYRGQAPPGDFELDPARTERSRVPGSGRARLSLYVSRRLVEAHGGHVEAGTVNGVTTLAFVLPGAESEAA